MKKIGTFVGIGICLALAASLYGYLWSIRIVPDEARKARRTAMKFVRSAKSAELLPYLEGLFADRGIRAVETEDFPYLSVSYGTAIPVDSIAFLVGEAFIRCSGNGKPGSEDVPGLKALLAFSDKLMPELGENAAIALKERRLDAYFLSGDIEGAIAIIDAGLPGRSEGWCKGTVAKLRAHKAMDEKNNAEAIKQFLIFADYMASDEMKDFEDCDPTTGIVYSREWVCARNYVRCADLAKEMGDAAKVAEYRAKAKDLFKVAEEKAKEDEQSLKSLKDEIKAAAL